ncbi:SseB family protein [Streptomyces sp. V1I1]|uniref:SseB family protein n=1 Tax=Streptomyces sp. V1I1 TaxID=3042272 RepID=UPI002783457E|nr:SseB family protein [Streptomyces sp. V1I1]MDQ0943402.1 hypothetical protein [Streptomyces sp. V1I1]
MTDNGDDIPKPLRVSRLVELAEASVSERPPAPRKAPPTAAPIDELGLARKRFGQLLDEFRSTAVLVPLDAHGSLWTADQNGVRWICVFSDENSLSRFAQAQGDVEREWTYRTILGARLLDVMVPMLRVPAGVALDAGSEDGMLFPPVEGIVPRAAAVDIGGTQ